MKKIVVLMFALMLTAGSAFAADDVVSVAKPVAKGTATVVKHVVVDTVAVGKTVGLDVYATGKYLGVGAVKGTVAVGKQLKHAFKK